MIMGGAHPERTNLKQNSMKTAKEKAEELLDKYIVITPMYLSEAKQCALIAVDEILNSNPCIEDSDRGGNFQWASNSYYWEQVKKEIEKL